jgi:hypothetical protein
MTSFNFDIDEYIRRLTPPLLRRPLHRAWLKALFAPLKDVNDQLLTEVDNALYLSRITGQTISLQGYLNDQFDNNLRRIQIIHLEQSDNYDYFDAEGQTPDYDYYDSESQPDEYMYFDGEQTSAFSEDFKVIVPLSLQPIDSQLRGSINKYKVAGVTYEIEYI